jgi:hypothetical protein
MHMATMAHGLGVCGLGRGAGKLEPRRVRARPVGAFVRLGWLSLGCACRQVQ